jgi:hypothetical protein
MEWWRFYTDVLSERRLFTMPAELYRQWTMLLCLYRQAGDTMPPVNDIAFALRITEAEAADAIRSLIDDWQLLDETPDGIVPHNWPSRQFKSDSSTPRVQRHRANRDADGETAMKRYTAVSPAVTATPPESDTDTDTDTEQRDTARVAPAAPVVVAEQPYGIWLALCEECGADPAERAPSYRSKQLAVAKRLLEQGYGEDKVRRCVRYLLSEEWRTSGIDLLTVEKEIGKWELAGMPAAAAPRASPNGRHAIDSEPEVAGAVKWMQRQQAKQS